MTVFHSSLYDLRFPFLFLPLRLEMSSILVCSVSVSDVIIVWFDVVMRVKINDLGIFHNVHVLIGESFTSFDGYSVSKCHQTKYLYLLQFLLFC